MNQEFWALLKKTKDVLKWNINSNGAIRAIEDGELFCPLTGAIYAEYKVKFNTSQYAIAGSMLRLDPQATLQIVSNADMKLKTSIRDSILSALGLEEIDD